MLTEEQLKNIKGRLDRYYETDEIDIDLANHIHNDASALIRVTRHLQNQNKQLIEVLKFYAAEETYDADHLRKHGYIIIESDGGAKAQHAIKQINLHD